MSRDVTWQAGDVLTVQGHTSPKGLGLSYESGSYRAQEPGSAGGWDVYDVDSPDGGRSIYGFSVRSVAPADQAQAQR